MARYRRIRIRTATREWVSVARPADSHGKTFCPQCGADVGWLGLTDAAIVSQMTPNELVREIELGHMHARETPEGQLRICRVSILKN